MIIVTDTSTFNVHNKLFACEILIILLPYVVKLEQDTNLLVGSEKERLDIKAALSNSFGFGGHNSSIIFAPYK